MPVESHITRQLLTSLAQGRALLAGVGAELYTKSPTPIAESTIGAHFRHVLDGLSCLLAGVGGGRIDYDRREREQEIEISPDAALARIDEVTRGLARLAGEESRPLAARADVPEDVAPESGWVETTLGRELLFALSHTIHHFALIAMILRHLGREVPEGFGVAPSTLLHWEEVRGCAPLVG